jgi:hypothetical protein
MLYFLFADTVCTYQLIFNIIQRLRCKLGVKVFENYLAKQTINLFFIDNQAKHFIIEIKKIQS